MSPRRSDDEPSGLPPEWAGFVAPDDISELDAEIRALRAEWQGASRRWWGRKHAPRPGERRWRRYEPSGLLLLAGLIVALFCASLGVFLQPAAPRVPAARALAHPDVAPGTADALVPDLALTVGRSGSIRLRNIRPAVVLLLPPGCACSTLANSVISAAGASRLKVLLVGRSGDPALPSTAPRSRVSAGTDSSGRLATAYQAGSAPLALFVRADGTVSRVLYDPQPGAEVRQEIAGLAH